MGFVWCCWLLLILPRLLLCTCPCWCWMGTGCSEASRPLGCPPWGCQERGGRRWSVIQLVRPSAQPRCVLAGPPENTHRVKLSGFVHRRHLGVILIPLRQTNLLQELDLGLEHLLHVIDFLLSLLTSSLQLCLIVIGQALCCCTVTKENTQM